MPCSPRIECLFLCLIFTVAVCVADDVETPSKPEETNATSLEHVELKLNADVAMELVKVAAGKFQMGSDSEERTRVPDDRENPQHEVTITRDFFMGTREVTRGQFAAFVDATGYLTQAEREGWGFAWNGHVWDKVDGATWKKVGFEQTDQHPVICISFDDAIAFCRWFSGKTSRKILLPSEAQWEYAARAGTTTAFPWGDEWEEGDGWANAADEAARKRFRGWRTFRWDDKHIFTSPVGTYRANAFGIHDMIGNAWEWTSDWYDKDYYKQDQNVDPQGPATGSQRVIRGGCWMSSPPRCRSAGRLPCNLRGDYCDCIVGFRVVVDTDTKRELPSVSLPNRSGWPDFRGPRRDGVSHHVPTSLPEKAEFLWTIKTTGPGHSGIAVSDGRVLLADKSADNKKDIWRCLDAQTGKEIWSLAYKAEGKMPYTNSPRATPVIHDGMVYLLGAFGHLHCVKFQTGEVLWKKHLIDEFGGKLPAWGMTSTPMIVDDKLIINPGAKEASIVALERKTGEIAWKSAGTGAAYASPILHNFRGQRQVIGYDNQSLGGWNVVTGERLWKIAPDAEGDYNVATPIALAENLVVATENNSTRLYAFTGKGYKGTVEVGEKPKHLFEDLAPDMTTPVAYNGMIFCPHNAALYCLDAKSLELLWEQRDKVFYDYSALIAGNGHVMIATLGGELLLLQADRKQYKEVARLRLFDSKKTELWSFPALVKGRLYIRNENSISCLLLEK